MHVYALPLHGPQANFTFSLCQEGDGEPSSALDGVEKTRNSRLTSRPASYSRRKVTSTQTETLATHCGSGGSQNSH